MGRFDSTHGEHRAILRKRAESLKPSALNVVATSNGWAQIRTNGQLELLVSFRGLDELLGDFTPEVVIDDPIQITIPSTAVEPEVVEEAPKKKPGRPTKSKE